jgi:hypothetical protein
MGDREAGSCQRPRLSEYGRLLLALDDAAGREIRRSLEDGQTEELTEPAVAHTLSQLLPPGSSPPLRTRRNMAELLLRVHGYVSVMSTRSQVLPPGASPAKDSFFQTTPGRSRRPFTQLEAPEGGTTRTHVALRAKLDVSARALSLLLRGP